MRSRPKNTIITVCIGPETEPERAADRGKQSIRARRDIDRDNLTLEERVSYVLHFSIIFAWVISRPSILTFSSFVAPISRATHAS